MGLLCESWAQVGTRRVHLMNIKNTIHLFTNTLAFILLNDFGRLYPSRFKYLTYSPTRTYICKKAVYKNRLSGFLCNDKQACGLPDGKPMDASYFSGLAYVMPV